MTMTSPVRVVIAVDRYMPESYGGGEQQARKLGLALSRLGLGVTILSPRQKPATPAEEHEGALRVRRFRAFLSPATRLPGTSLLAWSLQVFVWLIANRRHYDLIHIVHVKPFALPVLLAAALLGKPAFVKPGTGGPQNDFAQLRRYGMSGRLFGRLIDRLASGYLATSRAIAADLGAMGVAAARIFLIPNGVTVAVQERPNRAARTATTFLYFGRIDRHKAVDLMVRGFAALPDHTALRIVGGGSSLAPALDLARALGVAERIDVRRPVVDTTTLFDDVDFYVSTSLFEGLSNGLLEAMTHGVPAIVSRVSGVEDVVRDGVSGFIFEAGNQADYECALNRALALTPEARRAMGGEARRTVRETFDIDVVARAHAALYRGLLQPAPRSPAVSVGDIALPGA